MERVRFGSYPPRRVGGSLRSIPIALVGVLSVGAHGQQAPPASRAAARPNPGGPASEVAPAEVATHGLELRIDLHEADRRRASRFASLQDATLWMRFKNVAKEAERIAIDEADRQFRAASLLLDLELTRDDGQPLPLPAMHTGSSFDPVDGSGDLLFLVPVRWLAPDASFDWTVPLVALPGWQSLELAPGLYRLRVVYHGPPDLTAQPYPDEGALRAWRGRAVSQTLRFEITGAEEQLEFGPAQSGLRFAPRPDPFVARWRTDERIPMEFVVENVTDAPIQITRELGGSQEDRSSVRDAEGKELVRSYSMSFGWSPVVTFTLAPHERMRLYARPLTIGDRGVQASGWGDEAGPPGRYVVRHRLALTAGDPTPVNHAIPSRSSFDVPPRTVEILSSR